MQQQLFADMDRVDYLLQGYTLQALEEARRASPEYRAAKKDLKVKTRRRRLAVVRVRLLAIVGK
jgi:hypothetical protein